MARWLTLSLALLACATPLRAQRMTEQFIPIGRSPGVSGTLSVIGTIEAVDAVARTLRIAGPQGPVTVAFTDTTFIWIDRSAQGESATEGTPSDLIVGRRAEAKFLSPERRDIAAWIKVAPVSGGGGAERETAVRVRPRSPP